MYLPLTVIVPALGVVTSNALMLAALPAILKIRESRKLGGYNPLPPAWGILNCMGWLLFAFVVKDPFVFCSNILGLGLSAFYMMTLFDTKDANRKQKDNIMIVLCLGLFAVLTSGFFANVIVAPGGPIYSWESVLLSQFVAETIAGMTAVFFQLCFYSAPLTALVSVISERNSIYFSLPIAAAGCLNSSLWFTYGMLTGNEFLYVPSGASFFVAVVQVLCCFIFSATEPSAGGGAGGEEREQLLPGAGDDLRVRARRLERCVSMIM